MAPAQGSKAADLVLAENGAVRAGEPARAEIPEGLEAPLLPVSSPHALGDGGRPSGYLLPATAEAKRWDPDAQNMHRWSMRVAMQPTHKYCT